MWQVTILNFEMNYLDVFRCAVLEQFSAVYYLKSLSLKTEICCVKNPYNTYSVGLNKIECVWKDVLGKLNVIT